MPQSECAPNVSLSPKEVDATFRRLPTMTKGEILSLDSELANRVLTPLALSVGVVAMDAWGGLSPQAAIIELIFGSSPSKGPDPEIQKFLADVDTRERTAKALGY